MPGPIREMLEDLEERTLHPRAARSARSLGRVRPEEPDEERPAFQRDRDRLVHSKAFRRLAGKTQVFLAPKGDHYRTRLTHTLEVAQVARSVARALRLNEMLVEAMVMGHDLGHTPFGHAGERLLADVAPGGFHHVIQSVRVVEVLENDGAGLNLTAEVRDGILRHSKGRGKVLLAGTGDGALTLEAEIVRIADIVAYVNHDLDDAVRAGLLSDADVPAEIRAVLGGERGRRYRTLIHDVIASSDLDGGGHIELSPPVHGALLALRDFLYARVYDNPLVHDEFVKAQRILRDLWGWCLEDPGRFERRAGLPARAGETVERGAVDWLSGMTDRFAIGTWESLFVPRPWQLL